MAEIVLSDRAKKDLERLASNYAAAVGTAIDELAREPLSGKALKGEYRGLRSKRVGAYRIIYEFDSRKGRVLVVWVRHRSEAYR